MAQLPETMLVSEVVRRIYESYEAKASGRLSRRLGASAVGKPCERALWYEFRWAGSESFDGRMLRLFNTGHLEESRFIADLRGIGCEVHGFDAATGEQFEFTALGGHFVAKIDGVALNVPEAPKTWHTLSFKTASAKSFKEIAGKGVKAAKPEHWAQAMVEMHLAGIERCLYLAKNKDTDELYAERIHYDKTEGAAILRRAESVITSKVPLPQLHADRDAYPCAYCSHNQRCHGPTPPNAAVPVRVNCRTCAHATPVVEEAGIGRWVCEKHSKTLSEIEQAKGCEDHLLIPELVTFAKAVDAGKDAAGDWVLYEKANGKRFANTRQTGGYTSAELAVVPEPLIGEDELVEGIKGEFGAVAVEVEG